MCGINGFNFKDETLIQKMNERVKHRGPDDSGFWVDNDASLGHQRLSIIDLSERAHQPMEDDKYVIVFNGEIYNYRELKKELSDYDFKSDSDTEVILAGYRKWGRDCLQKFNGIFALAIWDKENRELFLARDRVGVKPLYYWQGGGKTFIFSSEIKAILEQPSVKREIDLEALNHYFRVLYVPGPLTMFRGIRKLEPGCYLVLKNGEIMVERYWMCDANDTNKHTNDTNGLKKEIQNLMQAAVRMQLISDRPLGVFLSGGIDSTSVLGNMVKLGHKRIKTFSVGFNIKDPKGKFNADFNLARQTAKHYNTDHHEVLISSKDILENIEDVVYHLDEPVCNTTQTATYLLAKFAKQEVAVVLGGDGGDELFGGYRRYRLSYLMSKLGFLTKLGKFLGKNLDYPKGIARYAKFMFQEENEVGRILNFGVNRIGLTNDFYRNKFELVRAFLPAPLTDIAHERSIQLLIDKISNVRYGAGQETRTSPGFNVRTNRDDFENQFMLTDFKTWLVDESLMRTDKMTMAFGLEQRVPILDHRMAELAYRIPSKMKLGLGKYQTKMIWKEAMDEFLPEHVRQSAHKKVWLAPMSDWLRYDLKDWVMGVLSKEYTDTSEFIDFDEVRRMFSDHCEKRKYNLNLIWAVITFQIWYKKFISTKIINP